jgi:hypothetical protein
MTGLPPDALTMSHKSEAKITDNIAQSVFYLAAFAERGSLSRSASPDQATLAFVSFPKSQTGGRKL